MTCVPLIPSLNFFYAIKITGRYQTLLFKVTWEAKSLLYDAAYGGDQMDLRVKRTRNSIRGAFLSLAGEHAIDRITVTELTKLAGINKATYYLHYSDLSSLVEELENELVENIVSQFSKADSLFRNSDLFFNKFREGLQNNQEILLIFYENGRTSSIQDKLVYSLRAKILKENHHLPFNQEMTVVLTFMLRGIVDVSLYQEYPDYDEVFNAISKTIRVVTDHYWTEIMEQRRLRFVNLEENKRSMPDNS